MPFGCCWLLTRQTQGLVTAGAQPACRQKNLRVNINGCDLNPALFKAEMVNVYLEPAGFLLVQIIYLGPALDLCHVGMWGGHGADVMERPVVGAPTATGGGDQLGFCNHTVRL